MTDTNDSTEPKAPSYSRNLTAAEREDRKAQLLVQHRERRNCNGELTAAQGELTKAKAEVDRIKRKRETIDEMLETLAIEAETGHAVIPEQLKLGTVPVLADDEGDAVEDPRDSNDDDDDDDDDDDEPAAAAAPDPDFPDDEGEPGQRPAKKRGKASRKKTRRTSANHANA